MSTNFKNLYTSNNPPLEMILMRGSKLESIHKVHAVISDKKGRVLMCAGNPCLLYTSPSPRDATLSRMPSSA